VSSDLHKNRTGDIREELDSFNFKSQNSKIQKRLSHTEQGRQGNIVIEEDHAEMVRKLTQHNPGLKMVAERHTKVCELHSVDLIYVLC
jgi:hypothetical protein